MCGYCLGNSEFVSHVCAKSIVLGELDSYLFSEIRIQPASDINPFQFCELGFGSFDKFSLLTGDVGFLSIGLGTDGDILSSCHRHCTGNKACKAGEQDFRLACTGGGHADD